MSHAENDLDHSDQPIVGTFLASRRSALLGLIGLAGSGCAMRADMSSTDSTKQAGSCESGSVDVSRFIEQFTQPLPEPISATQGFAKSGEAELWYRDTGGDGEAIILLHPSSLSGHCWGYQERAFSEAGYRVISYSRRGYRGTSVGPGRDTRDAVDDLLGIVDFLKLPRFHLVGTAGGSAVAAGFAARWPDDRRLGSLVVSCALPMFEKSADAEQAIVFPEKFLEFRGTPRHLRGLGTSYRDANEVGVAAWKKLNEQARGEVNMLDMASMQPFGAISSLSEFGRIKTPTLYLSGSADLFCTPILMNAFAKATPNSQFAIINGAGHSAFWEAPQEYNNIVMQHIGRARG